MRDLVGGSDTTGQTIEPRTVLDQGYLIVRGAIEPERLEPIRATAELFLDRARERSRGDANVGWDSHRVPHPGLYDFIDFIDGDTAALFAPLVSDRVLAVNRRLMVAPEVGLNTASLFTEPGKPLASMFQWHRDSVLDHPAQRADEPPPGVDTIRVADTSVGKVIGVFVEQSAEIRVEEAPRLSPEEVQKRISGATEGNAKDGG